MTLGFGLPAAGDWATPEKFARVAHRAEAGVTEPFLDPNVIPGGPRLEPVLALTESLAPVRP